MRSVLNLMMKRSKHDPLRLSYSIWKLSNQSGNIVMSASGRSRALAHELQLIDGGDFQKNIFNGIKRKALQ